MQISAKHAQCPKRYGSDSSRKRVARERFKYLLETVNMYGLSDVFTGVPIKRSLAHGDSLKGAQGQIPVRVAGLPQARLRSGNNKQHRTSAAADHST